MLPDGKTQEVPAFLLDREEITWPPSMPVKKPGEPVQYLKPTDFYRRHEIIEGQAYLFLKDSTPLTPEIEQWVRDQCGSE